jgi:aminoglycoside phosphotransferase (APT) family kinase protein
MDSHEFTATLTQYYFDHSDLVDPKITLDWVTETGWESVIYAYTLTSGPPDARRMDKRVMRMLTGANFDEAKKEYQILSNLHRAGYPVPAVYGMGDIDDGFRHPFILMQRIEGGDFSSSFPHTPEDDQAPLVAFIQLFRQLHTLDWRLYFDDPDELAPPDNPYYHYDRLLAFFRSYIDSGGMDPLLPLMDWLESQRERAGCPQASVVHWDFHADNILEDVDGKLYVVDWTSAEIGDYRMDLGWTLALTLAYSGEVRRKLVLDEYERQLDGEVPELDLFEAAAYLRRFGALMLSLALGADRLGMRPETVKAMRRDRIPMTRLYDRLRMITGLELPKVRDWLAELV